MKAILLGIHIYIIFYQIIRQRQNIKYFFPLLKSFHTKEIKLFNIIELFVEHTFLTQIVRFYPYLFFSTLLYFTCNKANKRIFSS